MVSERKYIPDVIQLVIICPLVDGRRTTPIIPLLCDIMGMWSYPSHSTTPYIRLSFVKLRWKKCPINPRPPCYQSTTLFQAHCPLDIPLPFRETIAPLPVDYSLAPLASPLPHLPHELSRWSSISGRGATSGPGGMLPRKILNNWRSFGAFSWHFFTVNLQIPHEKR